MVELTVAIALENFRARCDHASGVGFIRLLQGCLLPLSKRTPDPKTQ